MKKKKDFKAVIIIIVLLIIFIVIRLGMKKKIEEPQGLSVGSYNINMYIKYKDGRLIEVDSAPKEGNYELESKCESAELKWNNETHELSISLKNSLKDCKVYFKEI